MWKKFEVFSEPLRFYFKENKKYRDLLPYKILQWKYDMQTVVSVESNLRLRQFACHQKLFLYSLFNYSKPKWQF